LLSANFGLNKNGYNSFKFFITKILGAYINRFFRNATELNAMEIGFKIKSTIKFNNPSFITLINWDKRNIANLINKNSMVTYIGSLFDRGAEAANLLLPVTM
jgi:hypothetical protein